MGLSEKFGNPKDPNGYHHCSSYFIDPVFDIGTWLAQLLGTRGEDNSTELPAVLRDLGLKGSFAPLK